MNDRTTAIIARVAGPSLLVASLTLLVQRDAIHDLITDILNSVALSFTLGVFTLVLGLTVLAVHFRWNGAAQITVTLLGAALTIRGIVLMVIPAFLDWLAAPLIEQTWFIYLVGLGALALGAWFTWVGIRKPAEESTP